MQTVTVDLASYQRERERVADMGRRIAELEAENEVLRKAVKAYEDQAIAENRGAIIETMRGGKT